MCNFQTHFRSSKDHEHINIGDEIISQIRRSKFLIADFTGLRGGVNFEAGHAMGRGLPVFWTCRRDDLDKLHFGIRSSTSRRRNRSPWKSARPLTNAVEGRMAPGGQSVGQAAQFCLVTVSLAACCSTVRQSEASAGAGASPVPFMDRASL